MTRLLVSGASGGLAFHLLEAARDRGIICDALVRPETPAPLLEERGVQSTVPWQGLTPAALRRGSEPYDAVVHLAAYVHQDARQPGFSELHHAINHGATVKLARMAVEARIPRFVFASTFAVYGRFRTGRVDEDSPTVPSDPYGRSKLAAEVELEELAEGSRTELTVLRLPMVYGPHVKGNFEALLRMAALGRRLPLGSARGKRSFLYAGNFADAVLRLLEVPPAPGSSHVYQLTDGEDLTSGELYDLIFEAFHGRPGSYAIPVSLLRMGGVAGSIAGALIRRPLPLDTPTVRRLFDQLQGSSSAFREAYGWQPPVSPAEGVERTVAGAGGTPALPAR